MRTDSKLSAPWARLAGFEPIHRAPTGTPGSRSLDAGAHSKSGHVDVARGLPPPALSKWAELTKLFGPASGIGLASRVIRDQEIQLGKVNIFPSLRRTKRDTYSCSCSRRRRDDGRAGAGKTVRRCFQVGGRFVSSKNPARSLFGFRKRTSNTAAMLRSITSPDPQPSIASSSPRASDESRSGGTGGPATSVITKVKPKTKRPNLYRVLILNDDYTPMEFVVHVLEKFFQKDVEAATKIMLHVHHNGIGECGIFTYEIAETKVTQVMDFARKHQHPLQCVMEKK